MLAGVGIYIVPFQSTLFLTAYHNAIHNFQICKSPTAKLRKYMIEVTNLKNKYECDFILCEILCYGSNTLTQLYVLILKLF